MATASTYDPYMGFHTIKLDEAVYVEKDEKFGVVLRETHPKNLSFITIKNGTFGWMDIADITEPGQSFISEQNNDKIWKDLYDYKETAPIKVFTNRKAEFHVNYANTKGATNNNIGVYTYGQNDGSIKLNNLSLPGFVFDGWYTDSSFKTRILNIDTTKPKNLTLYAKWITISYSISYDLNGGQLPSQKTNPITYNIETPTIKLINPVKNGFSFVGWTGTDLNNPTINVEVIAGSRGSRHKRHDDRWF